jgi:hypothetical protein
LRVGGLPGDVLLRWGQEIDVQPIRHEDVADGEISPKDLSDYLSKYTCKSAGEPFGLDGRVRDPEAARALGASRHLVRMMQVAIDLSGRPALDGLARWVQTLGFAGHFTTKSRHWSITLGDLRAERVRHCRRTTDIETTLLYGEWRFRGVGWRSEGEAALVRYARADEIEARRCELADRWDEYRDARS